MNSKILEKNGISIIVPVYNSDKYLDKCISSILNQSFTNIEVVLVDDGSTDNSLDICKQYQKTDFRVKVYSQFNSGQISARKLGLANAKYDYIGFVDSDDWIEPNMYDNLFDKIINYDCDVVSSGIIHEIENSLDTKEIIDHFDEGLYRNLDETIYHSMLWQKETDDHGIYCNLVNKLFKKDILKKIYMDIDERVIYGEDSLAFYAYMMNCDSIYISNSSYYHYLIRRDSVCRRTDERLIMNTYYLYKGLEKVFSVNIQSRNSLLRQLKNYILQIETHIMHQMYDIDMQRICMDNNEYEILFNKKVVVYGAGNYGKLMYNYLKRNVMCEIVAWVDKYPDGKSLRCNHQILPTQILNEMSYDYILISVKDKKIAEEIKYDLTKNFDISSDLLIWKEIYTESVFKDVYSL